MVIAHITQSGNLSIPKIWREELGIEPNSEVIIEKKSDKIIIEPLKKKKVAEAFKSIDQEIKQRGIVFTRKEALKNDLYD